jgi:hypothetical protein
VNQEGLACNLFIGVGQRNTNYDATLSRSVREAERGWKYATGMTAFISLCGLCLFLMVIAAAR